MALEDPMRVSRLGRERGDAVAGDVQIGRRAAAQQESHPRGRSKGVARRLGPSWAHRNSR